MSNYAEFYQSNIYHIMRDKDYTICNIYVAAGTETIQEYAGTNRPLPKILSTHSLNRTLCPQCAERINQTQ